MQGLGKIVVTVSGEAGTGKSSTAEAVAKKLGFDYFSAGVYARELAQRHEQKIEHQARFASATIDDLVDGATREFASKHQRVVLDGRIAHMFFPEQAIKICITCPLEIRSARRAKDTRISPILAMRQLIDRDEADQNRLLNLRGVNFRDLSQYDKVICSVKSKEKVVAEAVDYIREVLSKRAVSVA